MRTAEAVAAFILDETNSWTRSPLVSKALSKEGRVPMNLNDNAMKLVEGKLVSSQELPGRSNSRVYVEPCEFERLLQRAMEVLSIRAQSATLSRS